MSEINSLEAINRLLELGSKAPEQITIVDGRPIVVIPSGCKVESLKSFFPPLRIERLVTLLEAGSFADYVNKFKMPETLIFAQVSEVGVTFKALLDYHSPAPELKPATCSHVATFSAIETPEWKAWCAADRLAMSQVKFAEWLEDNQKLFVDPAGGELLDLIRTLHGHQNARFNTSLRLDNGSFSVSYDEDVQVKGSSTTKAGEFELPPVVKAGIAVFQGSELYEVNARLKSRVSERTLALYFETIQKPQIIRESILALVKQISEKTQIIPLLGQP